MQNVLVFDSQSKYWQILSKLVVAMRSMWTEGDATLQVFYLPQPITFNYAPNTQDGIAEANFNSLTFFRLPRTVHRPYLQSFLIKHFTKVITID